MSGQTIFLSLMFAALFVFMARGGNRSRRGKRKLGFVGKQLSRIVKKILDIFYRAFPVGMLAGIFLGLHYDFLTGFIYGFSLALPFAIYRSFRKPRRKSTGSWYWGNERWRNLRAYRKDENSRRNGLPKGTCKCERCRKVIKGKQIHLDHIWPRSRWKIFQYAKWNTQILCDSCNRQKSDRRGHNWRRLRQWRLHPVAWFFRNRQYRKGTRKRAA